MAGDEWQKFANLRLLFGYMFSQPGKKLLFMGGEFGQWREWNHDASLDWHLLDSPRHSGLQRWVRDLNTFYRGEPALHELDCEPGGFEWVEANDAENSVATFIRKGREGAADVLIACNFTPIPRYNYRIGVPGRRALERGAEQRRAAVRRERAGELRRGGRVPGVVSRPPVHPHRDGAAVGHGRVQADVVAVRGSEEKTPHPRRSAAYPLPSKLGRGVGTAEPWNHSARVAPRGGGVFTSPRASRGEVAALRRG